MRIPLSAHEPRGAAVSTIRARALLRGWLSLALATMFTAPLCAATYVVATDESGDFTSIQTAIDTAYARRPKAVSIPPDTVRVMAGFYDEAIRTHDSIANDLILRVVAPDGPQLTRVRAIEFPPYAHYSGYPAEVRGLGIVEKARTGTYAATYHFVGCRFEGGYDMSGHELFRGYGGGTLVDCEFLDTTIIVLPDYGEAPGSALRGLRFRGSRTEVQTGCIGSGALVGCSFEGPADTLVFLTVRCELELILADCVFRNAGVAIARTAAYPTSLYFNIVSLKGCRFEDITGTAIVGIAAQASGSAPGIEVRRSRFVRCGRALDWSSGLGSVRMSSDTLDVSESDALRLRSHSIRLDSLVFLRGSGGVFTRLEPVPTPNSYILAASLAISQCRWEGAPGPAITVVDTFLTTPSERVELVGNGIRGSGGPGIQVQSTRALIRGNVVTGAAGDGISLQPVDPTATFVVDSNSIVSNAGDGIRFVGPWTNASRVFQRNLVARNGGAGLRVGSPFVGSVAFNDAWQNYLGDYAQVDSPLDSNLVADPLFCSLATGDLTLQFGSPCGAGGPYGSIGALPETCPTIVGAPAAVSTLAFAIHPNPARGEVLFTPPASGGSGALDIVDVAGRRVWSQPFRAGGAPIRWRGETAAGTAGAGLYWVRVTQPEGARSHRLVWLK